MCDEIAELKIMSGEKKSILFCKDLSKSLLSHFIFSS